jgi:hypothetical protein
VPAAASTEGRCAPQCISRDRAGVARDREIVLNMRRAWQRAPCSSPSWCSSGTSSTGAACTGTFACSGASMQSICDVSASQKLGPRIWSSSWLCLLRIPPFERVYLVLPRGAPCPRCHDRDATGVPAGCVECVFPGGSKPPLPVWCRLASTRPRVVRRRQDEAPDVRRGQLGSTTQPAIGSVEPCYPCLEVLI